MEKARVGWGDALQGTGRVVAKDDGSWLHPKAVSELFRHALATADLPPLTLQDLHHVAATRTHRGGGVHSVEEILRHSTITLPSDTYTSLLPEPDREIAEKAVKLIPHFRPVAPDSVAQIDSDAQATDSTTHTG
ncbi:hypothetical protein [Streptomyces sp. NPDC090080]|uniref:hypothetical protein n=1 Tax=Streptomyces sp. NPDC090080 TaxID=3365939 RepID=UPI0037FA664B